nr:lipoprotein lipase-like [Onthophagus taurus]
MMNKSSLFCTIILIIYCFILTNSYVYNGVKKYGYLPGVDFILADAKKTDVLYHVFTKNVSEGQYLTEETVSDSILIANAPTIIVIHGWMSNETTNWYEPLKNEYFKKYFDCNIIYIDWSKAGSNEFQISAANSKPIGEFIADFIIAGNFHLESVHVIGHSLGSHVAGFIGKSIYEKTSKKLGRITGTDPSGRMFEASNMTSEFRLADTDAEFVDIIHTDVGNYGFEKPIGMIDYYPNGGSSQPGCPLLQIDDKCSHKRSNLYFIESINSNDFIATSCESWENFKEVNCGNDSKNVTFGENVDFQARGVYYFITNDNPPFAQIK